MQLSPLAHNQVMLLAVLCKLSNQTETMLQGQAEATNNNESFLAPGQHDIDSTVISEESQLRCPCQADKDDVILTPLERINIVRTVLVGQMLLHESESLHVVLRTWPGPSSSGGGCRATGVQAVRPA